MLACMLMNETGIDILRKAFESALADIAYTLPKLLLAALMISVSVAIAIVISRIVERILKIFKIDELIGSIHDGMHINLTKIISTIIGAGIILVAAYSVVTLLFPEQMSMINMVLTYVARVVSIVFIIVFIFVSLTIFVERIRMEARLRGFMFIVLLFIAIILVIDVSALSSEVKSALAWGLSLGLGLAIGVFSAWYFFHEYLTKSRET